MVPDLKTFAHKGCCKSTWQKKLCFFLLHLFTPFKRLFASTSRSPMSKLFRFLESLGKRNWMKWSKIWKCLLINGAKSLCIFFPLATFALLARFFGIGATIYIGREMLCLPYARFLFLWMSLVFFLSVWQLSLLAAYSCWRYYIAGVTILLAAHFCWRYYITGSYFWLAFGLSQNGC